MGNAQKFHSLSQTVEFDYHNLKIIEFELFSSAFFQLKIRGQLTISGMRFTPYYLSHLSIDYIVFVSVGLAFIIGTQGFGVAAFKSAGAVASLVSLH